MWELIASQSEIFRVFVTPFTLSSTYYTQQNSVVMPVLNFVIKSRSFGDEELGIGFRTTQAIIGSCSRMFGLMLEGW